MARYPIASLYPISLDGSMLWYRCFFSQVFFVFWEFCQKVQLNSILQWELLSDGSTLSIDIVPCAREV